MEKTKEELIDELKEITKTFTTEEWELLIDYAKKLRGERRKGGDK